MFGPKKVNAMLPMPSSVRRHWRILRELEQQTDRGVAIIGAAYIEERLEETLLALFTDRIETVKYENQKVSKRLFKGTGPLTSLSAKIDTAFALGMLGDHSFQDLHLIRDIRNAFAHTSDPLTFCSTKIVSLYKKLWLPFNILAPGEEVPPTDPRKCFLHAVHLLYNFLWSELAKKRLVGDNPKSKPCPEILP